MVVEPLTCICQQNVNRRQWRTRVDAEGQSRTDRRNCPSAESRHSAPMWGLDPVDLESPSPVLSVARWAPRLRSECLSRPVDATTARMGAFDQFDERGAEVHSIGTPGLEFIRARQRRGSAR
jgi:hypothetical protein